MKLLLDTHTFLWMLEDNKQLSKQARELLRDLNNDLFLSIISPWEMAIKIRTEKFEPPKEPLDQFIQQQLNITAINLIDISLRHIQLISTLPLHHRDPFDRMLIAQSVIENMPIISADTAFDAYGITRLW
jgi:PIN domain nuclease of toxin-antitoxin system